MKTCFYGDPLSPNAEGCGPNYTGRDNHSVSSPFIGSSANACSLMKKRPYEKYQWILPEDTCGEQWVLSNNRQVIRLLSRYVISGSNPQLGPTDIRVKMPKYV